MLHQSAAPAGGQEHHAILQARPEEPTSVVHRGLAFVAHVVSPPSPTRCHCSHVGHERVDPSQGVSGTAPHPSDDRSSRQGVRPGGWQRHLHLGNARSNTGFDDVLGGRAVGSTADGFPGTYSITYDGENGTAFGPFDWTITPRDRVLDLTWDVGGLSTFPVPSISRTC